MLKFRKNDQIKVLSGKDKNKLGKIDKILPEVGVLVAGLNMHTKHLKPQAGNKGERLERNSPLPFGKFALVCPNCSQPTRVGFTTPSNQKNKIRICLKCKSELA